MTDFKLNVRLLIVISCIVFNAVQLAESRCHESEFTCSDGLCIPGYLVCDNKYDCPRGEDEVNCPPNQPERCNSTREYTCEDGQCISLEARCNRVYDCKDYSDEKNCPCKEDDFYCKNGVCIPKSQRCDGTRNCQDASDEINCPNTGPCNYYEWQCLDGTCIEKVKLCNQQKDCPDGSDEGADECSNCSTDEFRCDDGSCIDHEDRCNGIDDCSNSEDEQNCAKCKDDEFDCKDGTCIAESSKCDGTNDCHDGSDEDDCDDDDGDDDGDDGETEPCGEHEFQCRAGFCIMDYKRCNGIADCPSGNDEENCPTPTPPPAEECSFRCSDGTCGRLCDGYFDCHDGADEHNCEECNIDEFTCANGDCLPEPLRCNGIVDCPRDSSDEENCVHNCPVDHIKCDNLCILAKRRCDGHMDCKDGSDESNCTSSYTCADDEFDCGDGKCIKEVFHCDHYPDCNNKADELNCACDPATHFKCDNDSCIPAQLLCNTIPDCLDGTDENPELCRSRLPSTCAPSEHTCQDGSCIPQSNICDGIAQCQDGSDENSCGCRSDEFLCENGDCIPKYLHCNGNRECHDGSDEVNCPTPPPTAAPEPLRCDSGYTLCRSGDECYPRDRACNGYHDCRDGSDELGCQIEPPTPRYPPQLNLRTYPNAQDIKESTYKLGREVVFQCRDEGPLRATVRWSRGNGLPLPPGSRDNLGRLEIPNIQLEHAGTYLCSARGFPTTTPGSLVSVQLNVEPLLLPTARPPQACALNEATCANGDCIPKNLVCNGKFDCSDGSDETRCSPHGCEPNEFRCANKRCVLKTWVCDSDDDCGDGSDEIDCGTNPPGSQCSNKQFRCHSGNQCIPKSFHCDSENDCVDRSDEIGCSAVTIVKPPPPMVQLQVSYVFEIVCTAVGVPTPEIVWRLNWGHIPEKCKTTSVNGTGVLTCPDIQVQDSGAYSCEAINIRGSVFAVPDTILVVVAGPSVCPRGFFNEEAKTPEDCIPCFCFGVTDHCKSADLYTYQLQPPFDAHKVIGVNIRQNGIVDVGDTTSSPRIQITPTASRFGVTVYQPQTDGTYVPYFVMPENYNSNQLKSYGGYLKYNVQYRGGDQHLWFAPDVIISGNGYTLLHYGKNLQADRAEQVTVRFFVGDWIKRSETGTEQPATREEIMMALASVENILIKLQYVQGHIDTTLDSVEMDSAAARNTGLGLAVYVEECTCPIGYTGYSCENCAPGYVRHRSGPWLGQCYKEVRCPQGTYGDPSRGIPCRPCPCPHTSPPNQFTQTCSLGPDSNAICNCPVGYKGNRCEECDTGYTGNPLIPGDSCKPIIDSCDPNGSLSPNRDPYGHCQCKELTFGRNCDQCKPNTFHLGSGNLFGCVACFCMGITQVCRSSDYYRDSVSAVFASSKQDFKIVTTDDIDRATDSGITLDTANREIIFNNFTSRSPDVKYWSLPISFLGDKITAYGGNLQYTVRYTPSQGGSSSRNSAPDVELISRNHIRLSYYRHPQIQPNTVQTVSVPLLEQFWQRNDDGQQADREHLLMALADVQAILIKATYTTNSQEVALSSVSLDIAERQNTGNPLRAYEVEHCECPPGYVGLSCQDCDRGYKRGSGGLYLGLCTKCDCNGWSNECDPDTGDCIDCGGYRTGPYCEQCRAGYELNDLSQCVPSSGVDCLCDPRGSTSNHCYGGFCQCKPNVAGQTCNKCRPGTFGLNANLTEGCQSCFCSGVSTDCSESNMYLIQIPSEIFDSNHNFTLTDQFSRNIISTGFQINSALNEIGYIFRPSHSERLFWSLPRKFTGHRITSYGGKLEFTQRYSQRPTSYYSLDQDIIISGNGITIYWTNDKHQQSEIANKISVVLSPVSNWQRQDSRQGPRPASREDIMRVLANVDSILIRAQLSSDTGSSYISDITLDSALAQPYGSNRAVNVENCKCPPGYTGTSCELCDAGYYRDINDFQVGPFGSCTRCPCNNRESSCELANEGIICNCQPGYTAFDCSLSNQCDVKIYYHKIVNCPSANYTTTRCSNISCCDNGKLVKRSCPGIDDQTERPPIEPSPPNPPSIVVTIREPSLQIVDTGSNVEFHCEARTSTPNAVRILWTKDGGPLPDRAIDDYQGVLVITDVRISDSGKYICEASDGITVVSQHITLTVGGNPPEFPHATIYPSYIDIYQGESFDLRCDARGNPSPDIQWERQDNQPLNRQHSIVNGQLRITQANSADSGRYICRATNSAGTSSAYVDVTIRYVPTEVTQPRITPEYYQGESGSTFSLTCETNEDFTSMQWEREGGYLPYNHRSANGILTLTNARPEDSGIYVCIVTLITGQTGRQTATVTITEAQTGDYPTVRISPKNQTIGQGSTVELFCDATGTPQPTVKWTRVHEKFGPNTQQIGNTLRINPVEIEDRGIYVCVVTSPLGIAQDSSILIVERRERPELDIYPTEPQTVTEGGDIQIICRITAGIPQPFLTWSRRDGRPISQHVYQSNDVLRIPGVRIEDDGEYICTAANDLGTASASTTIVVTVPPRITLSHSSPLVINQGKYVRLECRAEGHPTPTVQWSRHSYGGPPEAVVGHRSAGASAVLEITSAETSDEGVYTCLATNSGGSREEYLQLQVETYPSRGDITDNGTQPNGEDPGTDHEGYPPRPVYKDNEHPPNILNEKKTAPVGSRAELRCRVDRYDERDPINTQWVRRNNQSLPYSSQTYGSTLYIDNVQPSDAGEYLCLGQDRYGTVRFTVTFNLIVLTLPHITLVPRRQTVRPYEHAVIQCIATGDPPIDIQWHADGREMPSTVHIDRGYLEFRGIQVSDAGMYRCTATNLGGKAESVAEVLVDEKSQTPTISADKRLQVALPGSSVTLHCVVAHPSSPDRVRWYRQDYPLPNSAQVKGEYLIISNLQYTDGGRYYCEVPVNGGGVVNDYIDLLIQTDNAPPASPQPPELTISATSHDVKYGDSLDLHCRSNEPGVILTWSKVNDRLGDNVYSQGGVLRFISLTTENNGDYRCETRGSSGYYYKDYNVDVIETVQEPTAPPLNIQYAPQGESIYMQCQTDLDEPVTYQWSKQNGELPQDVNAYVKRLRINDLTSDDAGTYICSGTNGRQTVNTPTVLVVTGIVPFFTQAPNSYLALPTISDHYARLNFEISFKPERDYGLILYNGNNKRKDFVSLAISGGHIEFKFNLGHDTTTLVSPEPVQIGKWHTVKVRRDRKTGTMFVDGKGPIIETGKGKYSGLTLTEPLYLGGVPNYHSIPTDIDIRSGFVGCISQLKVGHNYYDLLKEASEKVGVTTCETCQENPCQNQGVCQESLSKEGFTCICTEGFSGPTCNKVASESCTPYTCGVGRCVDNENSYECHCPIGRGGSHCETELTVYEPAFRRNAYVAYPPLKSQRRLKVHLKIKPRDVGDAILMYDAQDPEGHGNFVSLAIKDKHVEFKYDVGNGPVVLRSDNELQPGEYAIITAMRSISEGRLMVTGGNMVVNKSIGAAQILSLHTPLFLGGVNKAEVTVNPNVGVTSGFDGCIAEFVIVGVDLHITDSATGSANILDCSSMNSDNNDLSNDINTDRTQYSHGHNGCSNNPCYNDGQCQPVSSTEYRCSCVNGYTGHDCEIPPNQCEQLRPCENGGTCEGASSRYRCICPIDYQGINCEKRQHIGNEAHFEGNGFLEFDRNLLPHNSEEEEVIALQLSTNTSNGLVFWQGQKPHEDGSGRDYIGLAVDNGFLLFTFNAGAGPVDIPNDRIRVDDGKIHMVVLKRRANYGSIEIDNEYLEKGEGVHRRGIDIHGNIYLGGAPNISLMTGRFTQGFVGCIHAFEVQNSHTIELGTKAISGINVKPCSSSYEEEIVN